MLKKVMILLGIAYASILALVLALGLLTVDGMNSLHEVTNILYQHPFTVNRTALEIKVAISRMRFDILDVVVSVNPKEIEDELSELDRTVRGNLLVLEARSCRRRLPASWGWIQTRSMACILGA
jgi:hypothetical protein